MTVPDLCIRCEAMPATDAGWPHCDDCYQCVMNEVHEAWLEACEADDPRYRIPARDREPPT